MGFRKNKNSNQAGLLHRIDLFDFSTGDPALIEGRRQYLIIKGSKSLAYQHSIDQENALLKRKGMANADQKVSEQIATLARRMSIMVVSAFIDAGEEDQPDIIEFNNIDELTSEQRDKEQKRLRELFADVTDLAVVVSDEVIKSSNFLVGQGQSLSCLLSKESGTTQPLKVETEAA